MKSLVFATNNVHKIQEVRIQLGHIYNFLSLQDINCMEELPETTPSLEGNANQKARYVYQNYGKDCFSEDTGLEVEALAGAPGVITAHYAGPQRSANDNMDLLLSELEGITNRSAQFRTVITLILSGAEHQFVGICPGRIAEARMGEGGFGYDPIFIPEGFDRSFAQMTTEEKYPISHRGLAVKKLLSFLGEGGQ